MNYLSSLYLLLLVIVMFTIGCIKDGGIKHFTRNFFGDNDEKENSSW